MTRSSLRYTGKHIVLLLLFSPGKTDHVNEAVNGRTRLMKMLFLFGKEIRKPFERDIGLEIIEFPDFEPWHYGPFSKQVFDDLEFLVNNGYVEVLDGTDSAPEETVEEFRNWMQDYLFEGEFEEITSFAMEESFCLTEKGVEKIRHHYDSLSKNQQSIIKKFKHDLLNASLRSILRYTYVKYPEYATNSKVKREIIG